MGNAGKTDPNGEHVPHAPCQCQLKQLLVFSRVISLCSVIVELSNSSDLLENRQKAKDSLVPGIYRGKSECHSGQDLSSLSCQGQMYSAAHLGSSSSMGLPILLACVF